MGAGNRERQRYIIFAFLGHFFLKTLCEWTFHQRMKKDLLEICKCLTRTQTISFPSLTVTCALDKVSEGVCFHQ